MLDFNRQAELVPESIGKLQFFIVGAGGIGSNVAHTLLSMGAKNIILADGDVVMPENIAPGFFGVDQIGKPKPEAVIELLKRQYGQEAVSNVYFLNEKIAHAPVGIPIDVLIYAVDSLKIRSQLQRQFSLDNYRLFIDARMGGTQSEVYVMSKEMNPDTLTFANQLYYNSLEGEEVPLPCGQKATAGITMGVLSGKVAEAVRIFLTNPDKLWAFYSDNGLGDIIVLPEQTVTVRDMQQEQSMEIVSFEQEGEPVTLPEPEVPEPSNGLQVVNVERETPEEFFAVLNGDV